MTTYPIGTQYLVGGKNKQLCTITDILKTYNNAGELVKTRYVSTHTFMGQEVKRHDDTDVTVARGIWALEEGKSAP